MATSKMLSTKDRDYFRVVAESAFSNPFEAESLQLARAVAGGEYEEGDLLTSTMIEKIGNRLNKITDQGTWTWQNFIPEDRELVRVALLYDSYHKCFAQFDQLIVEQIQAGNAPCSVPFAEEILSLLRQRAFNLVDSLRYFGFFYQLRRAWYFIHHGLIGKNPSIMKLRSDLWRSIFTYDPRWYEKFLWNRMEDFSTFLIGETGTGKGTAAAAIGRSGFIPFDEQKGSFTESFTSNFIEINLSQFPESLLESELFGHTKGAFTGAVENHRGVFALCSPQGSIFLDEIGEVSIPVQIKLLKVLEERNFSAVGSHEKLHFDGRIIAATNKSLAVLQKEQTFRNDFYYRLCSNIIAVPPLRRQLKEDPSTLETLLDHTIQKIIGEPAPELMSTIFEILQANVGPGYPWPGNVRELEQAVRRILLNRRYNGHIADLAAGTGGSEELFRAIDSESLSGGELLTAYCTLLYQRHQNYEEVARITQLDRRTVKKYLQNIPSLK